MPVFAAVVAEKMMGRGVLKQVFCRRGLYVKIAYFHFAKPNHLAKTALSADIQYMSTNEVIERIATMERGDLTLVAEQVRSREDELLRKEIARRREDLKSGRVRGLSHAEVFGPLKKKYVPAR